MGWPRRSALAALAVLAPLGLVVARCALSPAIAFVRPGPDAPWVMAPRPVSAALEQWGRARVPVTSFVRHFEHAGSEPLRLQLRTLRGFDLFVNDGRAASDDGARWRDRRIVDATPWLRAGANEIRVDVANARGPALLELRVPDAPELATGPRWQVRIDGEALGPAVAADDSRRYPAALAVETPIEAARRVWRAWALLFALGAGGFLAARRLHLSRAATLPAAGLGLAALGWTWLFATKTARIPAAVGFDARHHLYYAAWIREKLALPLATDGWSTYHPPLFHALSAPLLPASGEAVGAALKLLPLLGGFGVVVASFLLARRIAPEDPVAQLLATGFAAVLPVNVYSAAYFSNEPLHAGLAALALWLGVAVLSSERLQTWRVAWLGVVLGLAALAKFTVVVWLPAFALLLGLRAHAKDRAHPARALALAVAPIAAVLVIAGWFYARNWILLGDPLIGNWSLPGEDRRWWQQPGFHTPTYYTSFGEALVHPYLAGFRSFWDSLYSTFWGDGFIAGRGEPAQRHGFWNYDAMSAGYLAALPATLLLAVGALRALRTAVADADPRRRAAQALLLLCTWSLALAFAYLTLRLPFFAQAKAAYLLPAAPALALWFAQGTRAVDGALARRGFTLARALLAGWIALCAGTLFLGFAG